MKAMVLAAGVGSRLDPLTATLPKPLVPVVNKPVMEHIVSLLRKHDFTDICANLHYLPENITNYFGDGSKFGVNLTFEMEARLSGDAGGVRACRKFLESGTFIVIMGDLITDADLSSLVKQHKEKKALASIFWSRKYLTLFLRLAIMVSADSFFHLLSRRASAFSDWKLKHTGLTSARSISIVSLICMRFRGWSSSLCRQEARVVSSPVLQEIAQPIWIRIFKLIRTFQLLEIFCSERIPK
jgi:molybdopterin-guanine dinucleotide biosynthesis protein A